METISIVIPAFNEEAYIGTCLEKIQERRNSRTIEVIVIDNASTDRTADIARGYPGVTVVHEERKGLTRARQRGLEASTGDILAWVDADTHISERWLDDIAKAFDADPTLASISGPYCFHDAGVIENLLSAAYWVILGIPTYWITGFMVVGGNFAVRRSALQKIGGFDTSIEFYGEDTNIARRLRDVGRVRFVLRMMVRSSARRLKKKGFIKTGWIYALNYLSQALGKRSSTTHYDDIR